MSSLSIRILFPLDDFLVSGGSKSTHRVVAGEMSLQEKLDKIRSPKLQNQREVCCMLDSWRDVLI